MGVRAIGEGRHATATQLLAIAFAYFERLISSPTPSLALKLLLDAIPRGSEDRKESSIFPFVAKATCIPSTLSKTLQEAQREASNTDGVFLKAFLEDNINAVLVFDLS